jgi:uncharacterized protein (TIGR02599 family)
MKSGYFDRIAFTIVEMLVSLAILALLLTVMVSVTEATRRTWSYTSGQIEEFRDAREAFESITQRLSQATLNTYWDYDNPTSPTKYQRQSELRFISGQASSLCPPMTDLDGNSVQTVTHANFFQAPLGYTSAPSYQDLTILLNTWGYFIEFGSDKPSRPDFINSMTSPPAERYRFRVMELMEPSDALTLYKYTNGKTVYSGSNSYTGMDWFTVPLTSTPPQVRTLAENIIALVLLPKLSSADISSLNATSGSYTDTSLVASNYLYDSTGTKMPATNVQDANLDPVNQLPSIVQVTMVAVDEATYGRYQSMQASNTTVPSGLGLSGSSSLFSSVGSTISAAQAGYLHDLQTLQGNLQSNKIRYRVFSTNVILRAAKWSRNQKN